MFYLSMAKTFIAKSWQAQVAYPLPFVLGIVAQFINYGVTYISIYFMIISFGTLNGWSAMEVLLLYAVAQCCYAIGACMGFRTMKELPNIARTGALNDYMVRPVNSLFYIVFSGFNVGYVSHLFLSIIVMVIAFTALNITLSFTALLWFVVSLICGGVITGCIMIILTIPSIVIIGNVSFSKFYYKLKDLINYPLPIFGSTLQLILTFIIPMGFVNYYPLQVTLNKSDTLLPDFVQYLSPLVAVVMVLLLIFTWTKTLNKYESTGA